MGKLENAALQTFDTRLKLWLRYVDDIFAILKRSVVQALLQHLNNQHPAASFTVEVESNNKLPFMDVTVWRAANQLETSVYRKHTHTGRYLSYASNHPDTAKRSVVRALMGRKEYVTAAEDRTGM